MSRLASRTGRFALAGEFTVEVSFMYCGGAALVVQLTTPVASTTQSERDSTVYANAGDVHRTRLAVIRERGDRVGAQPFDVLLGERGGHGALLVHTASGLRTLEPVEHRERCERHRSAPMSTSTMSEPCSEDRDVRSKDIATGIGCGSAELDGDLASVDGFAPPLNIRDSGAF